MLSNIQFTNVINSLRMYPRKTEWLRLKVNCNKPDEIGKYIAAISNSAAYWKKPAGYFIFGIPDSTADIIGTKFNYLVDVKGESLDHYLARNLTRNVAFKFHEGIVDEKKITMITISGAIILPVTYKHVGYIMIGTRKAKLRKYKERHIKLVKILRNFESDKTKSDNLNQN